MEIKRLWNVLVDKNIVKDKTGAEQLCKTGVVKINRHVYTDCNTRILQRDRVTVRDDLYFVGNF